MAPTFVLTEQALLQQVWKASQARGLYGMTLPEPLGGAGFDLVASNPPYIAQADPHLAALVHEPLSALASGADGLDDIRQIAAQAPAVLAPGGWLLLEHGWDQAGAVRVILAQAGLTEVQSRTDLAGIERCTGGRADQLPRELFPHATSIWEGLRDAVTAAGGTASSNIDSAGAGRGNALCSECHYRTHSTATGSKYDHLINFSPNVASIGATPMWQANGTGGTCTLVCHGMTHNPQGY